MRLTAMIDRLAELLELNGHEAVAAVLDTVSEELEHREGRDDDELQPVEATASVTATADATAVLKQNAGRVFNAVEQYGARAYRVDTNGISIEVDRGGVQTNTAFGFYSQDEAGKPQLRVTFTCGDDRMVRWASLDSVTGDSIARAVQHVFGTGENYGANVVTAATRVSAADSFYADDGTEHFWPEVAGFDIIDYKGRDRFGSSTGVTYQNMEGPGIIDFDGQPIADGKGPGRWSYRFAGKKQTGTFKSEADVPKLLQKLARDITKQQDGLVKKAMQDLQGGGWQVDTTGADDVFMTYELSPSYFVTVESFDAADLAAGESVNVMAALTETGGYENYNLLDDEQEVKGVAGMKRFAAKFLARAKKHLGDRLGTAAATTAKSRRSTPGVSLQVVDTIEQRVHDAVTQDVSVGQALRRYSRTTLKKALPSLDTWTVRHVTRYLAS